MSRYIYSNLLKIIFTSVCLLIFIPSTGYFIFSMIIDHSINIPSLILIIVCILMKLLLSLIVYLLNHRAKKRILFEEFAIRYQGKTYYKDTLNLKYFTFQLSITYSTLVIPKLHIDGDYLSVTCYLSKRDIKKLEKLDYEIKRI